MDLDDALRRLEAAKGDPDALAVATVDIALGSHEPTLREALDAAAIPHWFDEATLRTLLGDSIPDTPDWFTQLTNLAFVEKFHAHDAWNVHEVTRLALRDRLARDHEARFRSLGSRAISLVTGDDWSHAIERVYHLLTFDSARGAGELRRLWKKWYRSRKLQFLQALDRNLEELYSRNRLEPLPRAYALVALGTIRENRIALSAWEKLAHEALEIMTSLGDDVGLVDAHALLGTVLRERGQLAEALSAFDSAAERLEHRAKDGDNHDELNDQRASLHQELGRTLQERGQLREALVHFESAKAIREERCQSASEDDEERHELAVAYVDVGDALLPTSRSGEAEALFARALEVLQTRLSRELGSPSLQADIGRLRLRLGDALLDRGEAAEAVNQFEAAGETFRNLTRAEPDHFAWKGDLAQVDIRIAGICLGQNKLEEADQYVVAARQIYLDLAERDPSRPTWQQNLASLASLFAIVRERQARWLEAAQEHLDAERRLTELSESDSGRVGWKLAAASAQQALALFLGRIVNALPVDDEGKPQSLVNMLGKSKAARDSVAEVVERDPGNVSIRSSLAYSERVLATAMETLADHLDTGLKLDVPDEVSPLKVRWSALNSYASSAQILRELMEQDSDNVFYKRDLVSSLRGAARIYESLEQPNDALELQRLALAGAQELVGLDPTNELWAADLSSIQAAMARLQKDESLPGPVV